MDLADLNTSNSEMMLVASMEFLWMDSRERAASFDPMLSRNCLFNILNEKDVHTGETIIRKCTEQLPKGTAAVHTPSTLMKHPQRRWEW